ncbi:MAG: hypothetical protein AAF740_02250 [Bacteroidota bacterium]
MLLFSTSCGILQLEYVQPNNLPEATTEGLDTFGCRINGEIWTPFGSAGATLLTPIPLVARRDPTSFEYDPIEEIIHINARNSDLEDNIGIIINTGERISEGIYEMRWPNTTEEDSTMVSGTYYNFGIPCHARNINDSTFQVFGTMEITRFDRAEGILSGKFEFSFIPLDSCEETFDLTDGRFDLKEDL